MIDEIVKKDLCIGCGTCAGVCPRKALEIKDNEYGEYVPTEIQACDSGCGFCLEVCPFSNNENETQMGAKMYGGIEGVKYLFETGYYLDSYVGYSNEFRLSSASGGMATWLLTNILREEVVDYIVCPIPQKNPEKLFSFEILSDENSIKAASGSVYYPVEISEVVQKIIETPGRYAVTGLPCFIKALRLASQKNRKLNERIVFTIGIVCGQMKNKNYTEYISTLASKGSLEKVRNVKYRGKSSEKPASNYYFQSTDEEGLQYRIFWDEGVSEAWINRWFTPNACNYCDDVFAELADVVFMDAWLPEYSRDSRGTNLVLVRSPDILAFIQRGVEKEEISANKIPIERLIESQAGVLDLKRKQLSYRLYLAFQNGQKVPEKRVPLRNKIGFLEKREIKLKAKMQRKSKELFLDCFQHRDLDTKTFRSGMQPYIQQTRQIKLFGNIEFSIQVIKRIYKKKGRK